MNCPRPSCRESSTLLSTDSWLHASVRRRYLCRGGHHFTTVEAIKPDQRSVEHRALMSALRAIRERFGLGSSRA